MKILIAEDDPVIRRLLEVTLTSWGYEVQLVGDGRAAYQALESKDAPHLALLDWMLPAMDGLEICRQVRSTKAGKGIYIILLTTRSRKEDLVAGLEGGADDYIIKPFDREELHARLRAGCRIVELQLSLAARVLELEESAARIKELDGLLPICAWCKKVRNDDNYWQELDKYVTEHVHNRFTHGICPACLAKAKAGLGKESPDNA